MPIPLDPIALNQLMLVKQLYQQAYLQSFARSNPVNRITSIVVFDLATETILKTVVLALDSSKDPDKLFQGLLQSVDTLLASKNLGSVPDKRQIQFVHSLRNDAQHKTKYPSEIEVSNSRAYTSTFLENITLQVWDKKFGEISLTDLIQHSDVRLFLVEAENRLKKNDFDHAIGFAKTAFSHCINQVVIKVLGEEPHALLLNSSPPNSERTLGNMRTLLMLQTLGLNFAEYVRYQKDSGSIIASEYVGHKVLTEIVGPAPTEKEASYVLQYVIDAVVQIENYVGDIKNPFGLR